MEARKSTIGGDGKMTDEDFERYVRYGVDGEDFKPEAYSCENICTSCKFFELFGDACPCALNITCIGYDDEGKQIVAACSSYDNNKL